MNNAFTKWFILCVRHKYADFNGRARRKELWMFSLVYLILAIILQLIGFGVISVLGATKYHYVPVFLGNIFMLALLVPGIAVTVRRLHDVGKSGWWFLLVLPVTISGAGEMGIIDLLGDALFIIFALAAIAAALYFLYLMVKDGQPDANQWGENPKIADAWRGASR